MALYNDCYRGPHRAVTGWILTNTTYRQAVAPATAYGGPVVILRGVPPVYHAQRELDITSSLVASLSSARCFPQIPVPPGAGGSQQDPNPPVPIQHLSFSAAFHGAMPSIQVSSNMVLYYHHGR